MLLEEGRNVHISTSTIQHWIELYGYIVVFLGVGIESTGIPFPGETMLVLAAVYSGSGHLQIPLVIACAAAGAIIGDNLGYWLGRTAGREAVVRYGKYVRLDPGKLSVAEDYFRRHGDKTVFIGRFVAVLRAWAAFLAGVNRMPWPRFLVFNAAGGICWATLYGVLGFELGKNLPLLHRVETGLTIGGVVVALLAAFAFLVVRRRRRAHRQGSSSSSGGAAAST